MLLIIDAATVTQCSVIQCEPSAKNCEKNNYVEVFFALKSVDVMERFIAIVVEFKHIHEVIFSKTSLLGIANKTMSEELQLFE